MATGTLGTTARDYHTRQVAYLNAPINSVNLATGLSFIIGTIPANSAILRASCVISTVFSPGTTGTINIGSSSGGATIVSAGGNVLSAGAHSLTMVTGASEVTTVDLPLWVSGNFTGAAATSGTGAVLVEYAIFGGGGPTGF